MKRLTPSTLSTFTRHLGIVITLPFFLGFASPLIALAETGNYQNRDDVTQFINEMVSKNQLDEIELKALFGKAEFKPQVIKYILPPSSPTVRSWKTYRTRFVEPTRINTGLRFWKEHAESLQRAEDTYGVPQEIILGIIGVETIYGHMTGNFELFSALTTLAFDYPPRAELFRKELESLLLLARDEHRAVLSYKGSFAGAIGLPQFLPSSLRTWAVDFNGDGRIDLMNPDDAIGSVASFLTAHGWQKDGPVWAAARVDGEAHKTLLAEGLEPRHKPSEMAASGVVFASDIDDQAAALIDLVTPDGPTEYRLGYKNFYVITRYNRSSFYASAVADLAATLQAKRNAMAQAAPTTTTKTASK